LFSDTEEPFRCLKVRLADFKLTSRFQTALDILGSIANVNLLFIFAK